ncbi:oligosaccharide flippase family protein [Candidatus Leptofilum sp.]|uniref:oligosaccharide flippase family protein n=1 Tax=Candidatus Leptofilum sp. TaxID=3241576 RepID=UPI003B5A1068
MMMHPLVVNAATLFSGTAVARVFSALIFFLMARQLGPDNFGLYLSSISLVKLWSVLFSLGLDNWLLRNGRIDKRPLSVACGACLGIKVSLGGVWVIGFILVAPYLKQTIFPKDLVILAAFIIWLEELANLARSAFKSSMRNRITAGLVAAPQFLLLLITILFVRLNIDSVQVYFVARLVTSFIGMFFSIFLVYYLIGIRLNYAEMALVLRDTRPFAASYGLSVIYERADITIIVIYLGKTAAGLYGPAVTLMTTLFLIPQAIYEVALPWMSRAYAKNPISIPRRTFQLIFLSAFLGILLSVGMMLLARPLVLFIYGAEFAESGDILVILSVILLFKSVSFALASVITAVGWQSKRVIVQLVSAVLNVCLNLIFIQSFGLTGVAFIYIISESVLTLGYLVYLLKWQRENPKLAASKVAESRY